MITTINSYDFIQAFESVRPNNFSREGLLALFDYLEMLEDDLGEQIELDVIALCCEYSEYENLKEFQENYGVNGNEYKSLNDIDEMTRVISIDKYDEDRNIVSYDSFIIKDF